jgi:hypothetical protein
VNEMVLLERSVRLLRSPWRFQLDKTGVTSPDFGADTRYEIPIVSTDLDQYAGSHCLAFV